MTAFNREQSQVGEFASDSPEEPDTPVPPPDDPDSPPDQENSPT